MKDELRIWKNVPITIINYEVVPSRYRNQPPYSEQDEKSAGKHVAYKGAHDD